MLAEGLRLQGLLLELLYEAGHETASIHGAQCSTGGFRGSEGEEPLGRKARGKLLKELEDQTEERARVLATEALPHFITSRCKKAVQRAGASLPTDQLSVLMARSSLAIRRKEARSNRGVAEVHSARPCAYSWGVARGPQGGTVRVARRCR